MATKIAAARIARAAGCATLITLGSRPRPLAAIADGEKATLIEAGASPAAAYKAWIAGSLAPQGWVTVDAGAAKALASGKSLLARPGSAPSRARSTRATPSASATRPAAKSPAASSATTAPTPTASPACAPTPSRPNWASPKAR
jgi:hypothetical protein